MESTRILWIPETPEATGQLLRKARMMAAHYKAGSSEGGALGLNYTRFNLPVLRTEEQHATHEESAHLQ